MYHQDSESVVAVDEAFKGALKVEGDAGGDGGPDTGKPKPKRAMFSGKIAFVLAAAASAIGLGNIWRFPYLAAKYGGGAFLLVYLILVISFGFTVMIAELAIGRRTGQSAIGAFSKFGKKYRAIGWFNAIVPLIITPYYCVIGGWIVKYFAAYCAGEADSLADGGTYFSNFIASNPEPVFWTLLFVVLTIVVVAFGVQNGIERLNRVLMPALIILSVALSIYSCMLPGALDGLYYYLVPNLSAVSINTVVAAMGQMFYSLSLAMGIMITYGSYVRRDDDLEKSVRTIEIFDTGIAFLAGLMIVPAVFAFSGGEASAVSAGPSLMFITLPEVFDSIPFGGIIGLLFFLLVVFAALTSAISLTETVISIVQDRSGWSRKVSVVVTGIGIALLAILPTLGFSTLSGVVFDIGASQMTILDFMDFISNSVLMPLAALLTCLFVGWWVSPKMVKDEIESTPGVRFKSYKLFEVMIKIVAPIFLVVILASSIMNAMGIITL